METNDFLNDLNNRFKNRDNNSKYPMSFFNEPGNMLEVFLAGDAYYAKRIDNILTLLISDSTGEVVGYHIKNISKLMPAIKEGSNIFAMHRMD